DLPPRPDRGRRRSPRRHTRALCRARPGRGLTRVDDRRGLSPGGGGDGELLPGPQAQASLYAFQLVERRAKKHPARPTETPRKVDKIGIVGAGLMARQIALLFLRRLELPIVIRDVKQEIVDEALGEIRVEIERQVAKG